MTSGIVKAFLLSVLLDQAALVCVFPSGTTVRPVINVTLVLLPFFKQVVMLGGTNLKRDFFVFSSIIPLKIQNSIQSIYLPCRGLLFFLKARLVYFISSVILADHL